MNLTRNQTIIIGVAGLIALFFILLFLGLIPGLKAPGSGGGTLNPGSQTKIDFWGVAEVNNANAIQSVINEYSKINNAVSISYRQFDNADTYEKTLLNALATNQGPDILMFHNTWLPKHLSKLASVPETIFNLGYLAQLFPDIIKSDFVSQNKIYALPLYIDTLALIYNKDIFNSKSIALPPKTWSDFQSLIPQLRELNTLNQITKPAAAIGGSNKSIDTASDILNLLMLQFGSQFINQSSGEVSFGNQGLAAFNFYLSFANPSSQYYTWNDNLTSSIDSFSQGDLAMIFNYNFILRLIKAKNPYLNIRVSNLPQFYPDQADKIKNYANYWGLAVSKQSKNQIAAWNFIVSAAANYQIAEVYLTTSGQPPALNFLIEKYKDDPNLGVFVRQALTSDSWPQPDNVAIKTIFSDMISSVLSGQLNSKQALDQAQNQINELK